MNGIPSVEKLVSSVDAAVRRFNDSIDRIELLCMRQPGLEYLVRRFRVAHEQAIAHRLAFYLEANLREADIIDDRGPIVLDCEYNQHLFGPKRLRVLKKDAAPFLAAKRTPIRVEGRDDVYEFEIRPDLLVHRRGHDVPTNLIVLEIKRWTNPDRKHDEAKLRLLTQVGLNIFGYVLGAAIYARNDREGEERTLDVGLRFHEGRQC